MAMHRGKYTLWMNIYYSHLSNQGPRAHTKEEADKKTLCRTLIFMTRVKLVFSERKVPLTPISFPLAMCASTDKYLPCGFKSCASNRIKV